MSRSWKAFIGTLVVVVLGLFSMACPKKPKVTTVPTTTTQALATTETVPPVAATTETATSVKNEDFVKTETAPPVQTENLPNDIEDANRVAQQRGFIQDAFFGYDESALSPDAQAALTSSANWLKGAGKSYNLLVEGHCDERGTEQYNLALGDRRANIAKEYLVTLGVDASRIRTVSYGEERPFDPGHDETAWAKNRRAHLVLVGR
jgi:peptidoglycan-associated lipoprotein